MPLARILRRGFSLLEVMVALSVISVGVLGLAGLQLAAKRAGHEAMQRTTAASLAMDIMARMRANPQALHNYVSTAQLAGFSGSEPTPGCNSSSTACTPAELAAHDLWQWGQALNGAAETRMAAGRQLAVGGLLEPSACISVNSGRVTIAIAWAAFQELSDPGAHPCGAASGKYGPSGARRQLLVLHSFVSSG